MYCISYICKLLAVNKIYSILFYSMKMAICYAMYDPIYLVHGFASFVAPLRAHGVTHLYVRPSPFPNNCAPVSPSSGT